MTVQLVNNNYINYLSRFATPKQLFSVAATAFAYYYYEPASLLGRATVLAGSYFSAKATLFVAEMFSISRQYRKLQPHRTCGSILSAHTKEDINITYNKAVCRLTQSLTKDFIISRVARGLCYGEVVELARLVRKNPLMTSNELVIAANLEQIFIDQIERSIQSTTLTDQPLQIDETSECVVIALSDKYKSGINSGHTIFIQSHHGIFRFYDGNALLPSNIQGFYEFPSKAALEQGLNSFINNFYENVIGLGSIRI